MQLPKIPLARNDFRLRGGGLPPSLREAMEAEGGLWYASDAYTTAAEVIEIARRESVRALRLDFRDLSLLEALPDVRYLDVESDGRPIIGSVAALKGLRALILHTGGLRGELDATGFPDLRWLSIGLGGKSGEAMLPSIRRGHPNLEWLSLRETKARTAADLCAGFPALRTLHIGNADSLRELGDLPTAAPRLQKLGLHLAHVRSLSGIDGFSNLETLDLFALPVRELTPLQSCPRLRYLRLELARLETIEALRNHPSLRMLSLNRVTEADLDVIGSIPNLAAAQCTRGFGRPVPWPDLHGLPEDDPLRAEWSRAMKE